MYKLRYAWLATWKLYELLLNFYVAYCEIITFLTSACRKYYGDGTISTSFPGSGRTAAGESVVEEPACCSREEHQLELCPLLVHFKHSARVMCNI
jgi:hypothetical protein